MDDLSSPAIETFALRKVFGEKTAVEDLSMTVQRGEVFGFLGPNGAGKTTSIKMLLGLISPSSGEGRLFGKPLGDNGVRSRVGFLPEHFRFHDWLTAEEFLQLHADLYRIPSQRGRQRILELLELVSLTPFARQKLRTFSKGMLQRIGLAQALLNDPDLVFLDEPTSGLDPVGRLHVRDIIRSLRERGAAVFLNSHLLSEVEITCDRVAFIKHGKVVRVADLHAMVDGEISVEVRVQEVNPAMLEDLSRWGSSICLEGDRLTLSTPHEENLPEIHRFLVGQGARVYSFSPQKVSLEDLFIQIVGTEGGL